MGSTFGSLNTSLTALQFNRVLMDTANSNIANADTEGYTRRRTDGLTIGAPNHPALWSTYVSTGEGVLAGASQRLSDELLNNRARGEHAAQSYLDTRASALDRVEAGLNEPSDNSVASALQQFSDAWADLVNQPNGDAERAQVLAAGASLVQAIKIQSDNLDAESSDDQARIGVDVAQVNGLAAELAQTNKTIRAGVLAGNDVNSLLDQRDQLAMKLSELVGAVSKVQSDGTFVTTINGVDLVNGQNASQLNVSSGVPQQFDIGAVGSTYGATGNTSVADGSTTTLPDSEIGALARVVNVDINGANGFRAQLNAIAQSINDAVNALHQSGADRNGAAGQAFFVIGNAADPAGTLQVNPALGLAQVVASVDPTTLGLPAGTPTTDHSIATKLSAKLAAEDTYQSYVNGIGSTVASAHTLSANQQAMTTQVDAARDQLSGVDLDEEMSNMMQAQRAYEAAARVMTAIDSILDTLINRTGLVGR